MSGRCLPLALLFLATACDAADLPPRYQDLHRLFDETKPHLIAIERELEKDNLWQLVPHYVDGTFKGSHTPKLTSSQTTKYKDLLRLVPYASYVDKSADRTDFSLGSITTDRWDFFFQFIHTSRRARPASCNEVSIDGISGVCSSDLGNDWALWVSWFERSDGMTE